MAERYGESNSHDRFTTLRKARELYEDQHGEGESAESPMALAWAHLMQLGFVHGDLEHHREKVSTLDRYNTLYDPDLLAERAWPLMKLGEYERARQTARAALKTEDPQQVSTALNAFCAIEFEAGNVEASRKACKRALEAGKQQVGGANAVDYTNYAEAARSVFDLAEAERAAMEATRVEVSWYGSPWVELAELYLREARSPKRSARSDGNLPIA